MLNTNSVQLGTRHPVRKCLFSVCLVSSEILVESMNSGFALELQTIVAQVQLGSIPPFWLVIVFNLVMSCTLLCFTRISKRIGPFKLFVAGLTCTSLASLLAGLTQTGSIICIGRALQGLGVAAFVPPKFVLACSMYKPGGGRNMFFGLLATGAPLGTIVGLVLSAMCTHDLHWAWYFRLLSVASASILLLSLLAAPPEVRSIPGTFVTMDWPGVFTVTTGLILVEYALCASPYTASAWRSARIVTPMVVGVVILGITLFVEERLSKSPLLPATFFRPRGLKSFLMAFIFFAGAFNVFLYYSVICIRDRLDVSPFTTVVWYLPMCISGILVSLIVGKIANRVTPWALLILAACGSAGAPLLLISPDGENITFWPRIFFSMAFASLGIDITYTLATIIVSNTHDEEDQALGGAVVYLMFELASSVWLSLATQMDGDKMIERDPVPPKIMYFVAASGITGAIIEGVSSFLQHLKKPSPSTFHLETAELIGIGDFARTSPLVSPVEPSYSPSSYSSRYGHEDSAL